MKSPIIDPMRVLGAGMVVTGGGVALWSAFGEPYAAGSGPLEVPSLTVWGKVFSCLLLGALGVAYLVWRRPIVKAQAILETSPLGTEERTSPLVDWVLYLKAWLAIDLLALAGIWVLRLSGLILTGVDTLGILASGAIVAFVVHLLLLSRRSGRTISERR